MHTQLLELQALLDTHKTSPLSHSWYTESDNVYHRAQKQELSVPKRYFQNKKWKVIKWQRGFERNM